MALLPDHLKDELLRNGTATGVRSTDQYPVVKLRSTVSSKTWILSKLVPRVNNVAYGLCDLANGGTDCRPVNLKELEKHINPVTHLPTVILDKKFKANYPMSVYIEAANMFGKVTDDQRHLKKALKNLSCQM